MDSDAVELGRTRYASSASTLLLLSSSKLAWRGLLGFRSADELSTEGAIALQLRVVEGSVGNEKEPNGAR